MSYISNTTYIPTSHSFNCECLGTHVLFPPPLSLCSALFSPPFPSPPPLFSFFLGPGTFVLKDILKITR